MKNSLGFTYDPSRDRLDVQPQELQAMLRDFEKRLETVEDHIPSACHKCGDIKGTVKVVFDKEPILYKVCHRCDKISK